MKEEDQFYKECDEKYCPANKRFIGSKSKNCYRNKEKRVGCYQKYIIKYNKPIKPILSKKKTIKKQSKRNKRIKKLDAIWHEIIILLWNGMCAFGSHKAVWGHHYIRKLRSLKCRFSIKNGVAVCDKCHKIIHSNSLELEDQIVMQKLIDKWGYGVITELEKLIMEDFDGDFDRVEKELKVFLKKLRS